MMGRNLTATCTSASKSPATSCTCRTAWAMLCSTWRTLSRLPWKSCKPKIRARSHQSSTHTYAPLQNEFRRAVFIFIMYSIYSRKPEAIPPQADAVMTLCRARLKDASTLFYYHVSAAHLEAYQSVRSLERTPSLNSFTIHCGTVCSNFSL